MVSRYMLPPQAKQGTNMKRASMIYVGVSLGLLFRCEDGGQNPSKH
jgi:hypothetical protein